MPHVIENRLTRDGRKRAPQKVFGVHHQKPFPTIRLLCVFGVAAYFVRNYYNEQRETPQQKFLRKVQLSNYGVLGTQLSLQGSQIRVAYEPDENTVVVDPAGLQYIHGVAALAGGAAGAIYNWLGLKGAFPEPVRRHISAPCDAAYHEYESSNGGHPKRVIHAVGPDFRQGQWSEREAAVELSRAYRNVLHEFAVSEADKLRLLPLSGGVFAGPLYNQLPPITQEALSMAFEQLHQFDKEYVLRDKKSIELCVFMDREYDSYRKVFENITPPARLK